MLRCTRCEGFVPASVVACPNCTKPAPRRRKASSFLAVVGAGTAAITLMACYGAAPCPETKTADGGTKTLCGEGCSTPQPDGGSRFENPTDVCFLGAAPPADAGSCDGGGSDGGC